MIEPDTWLRMNAASLGIAPAHINPHSADLCLGWDVIEMRPGRPDIRFTLADGEAFEFLPGRFYLCHTAEHVTVPETHRAQLLLKSSTARKGLNHLMAGYLDSGFSGQVTLEFVAYLPVVFRQGQRIVQVEFAQLSAVPARGYAETGRYMNQQGVTIARPEREI